jgi:ribonucleoside-diphosphate reductase subunit M1
MISEETYKIVKENATILDSAIIYDRDFNYNLCVFPRISAVL